jgi:hypothetical protein
MKRADAPPAGWYPDPRGAARLRWWDGSDWADHWRAPVGSVERANRSGGGQRSRPAPDVGSAAGHVDVAPRAGHVHTAPRAGHIDMATTNEIIAEVRKVARSEIDRAADVFTQRAKQATREIQPLISEYTSQALRWLRVAAVVAFVVVVGWFVFQAVAQASLFEWLGDRIDKLTE